MQNFLAIAFSFPTLVWTGLLLFCVLYWLTAMAGLADFDTIEVEPDGAEGGIEGVAGLMVTLGLDGVPLSVALTALSLCSWAVSYFAVLLLDSVNMGGVLYVILGVAILLASAVAGIKLATWLIKPLKPLFQNTKACNHDVLGKSGTAIYAISSNAGVLDCQVNGAHLRLDVRSNSEIAPGEKAVVIKYHKNEAVYQVVPEADFMTGLTR